MSAQVVDLDRLRKSCAQCSLHVLCLPAGIGGDDLRQLDDIVRSKRPLEQGETLFRAGQNLGSLFVAREGAFKTLATNQDGDVQVIGFHLPGELMGLDALGSGHHACEAQALTRATVCEIPLTQLEHVCSKVPERLALFLHGLSERYRQLGRPGDQFMLPMSREDIASYLGMVIETVSRTLTRMQDDGIISVRGRQLQILDMARLDAMVHGPAKPHTRAHP